MSKYLPNTGCFHAVARFCPVLPALLIVLVASLTKVYANSTVAPGAIQVFHIEGTVLLNEQPFWLLEEGLNLISTRQQSEALFGYGNLVFKVRSKTKLEIEVTQGEVSGLKLLHGDVFIGYKNRQKMMPIQLATPYSKSRFFGGVVYVRHSKKHSYISLSRGLLNVEAVESQQRRLISSRTDSNSVQVYNEHWSGELIRWSSFKGHSDTELAEIYRLLGERYQKNSYSLDTGRARRRVF